MSTNKLLKRSLVELYKSLGIPSENTTNEKIGQTRLIFKSKPKIQYENDSLEAYLRYMNRKKTNP
jgi:hypothetical protein